MNRTAKEKAIWNGYNKFGDLKKLMSKLDWVTLIKYREFILDIAIQQAKKEVFDDLDGLIDTDHPINKVYRKLKESHLSKSTLGSVALECCRCNNTIEGEIPQAFCWECVTKICKSNEESYRYDEKKESKN